MQAGDSQRLVEGLKDFVIVPCQPTSPTRSAPREAIDPDQVTNAYFYRDEGANILKWNCKRCGVNGLNIDQPCNCESDDGTQPEPEPELKMCECQACSRVCDWCLAREPEDRCDIQLKRDIEPLVKVGSITVDGIPTVPVSEEKKDAARLMGMDEVRQKSKKMAERHLEFIRWYGKYADDNSIDAAKDKADRWLMQKIFEAKDVEEVDDWRLVDEMFQESTEKFKEKVRVEMEKINSGVSCILSPVAPMDLWGVRRGLRFSFDVMPTKKCTLTTLDLCADF